MADSVSEDQNSESKFLTNILSKNFVLSRHFAVSMFNIVKFPNDECKGDGGKNGTCYTG